MREGVGGTFWQHVIRVLRCCVVQWLGVVEVEVKLSSSLEGRFSM